jgi:hypothetical protein
MIEQLTPSDYSRLALLMESRNTFLGVPAGDATNLHKVISLSTAKDLLAVGPSLGRIFGLYDEIGTLDAAVFTVVSQSHPCYYVNKAYTRPGVGLDVLPQLFKHVLVEYELLGYRRFYTLYRQDDIATYHKLWRTTKVLSNYITYSDLEIEPNIRPKHSDFWELLFGRSLYKSTMVVRGFIRKSESMFFNESAQT